MSGYGPGEAWAIVRAHACLVLDRDLAADAAARLHAALADAHDLDAVLALVRDEPLALVAAIADGDGWRLARTRGVPADTAHGALGPASIDGWTRDEGTGVVRVGDVTVHDVLPIVDGVVRARVLAWDASAPIPALPLASAQVGALAVEATEGGEPLETDAIVEDTVLVPRAARTAPAEAPQDPAAQTPDTGESLQPQPSVEPAQPEQPAWPAQSQPFVEPTRPEQSARPLQPEPSATPAPLERPATPPSTPAAVQESGIPGLIDSVPGFIRPASSVPVASPAASEPVAPSTLGDHDGMTIAASDARALVDAAIARSAAARAEQQAAAEAEPATGPLVLSTLCPSGHVQPSGTERCGRCGAAIDASTAARRARPEVAALALPTGERIPLGRGVVLGRRPRSGRVEHGRVPRLVAVESPNEDISRSHLEVRFDDWTLVATDLDSTNGTVLLRDGADPVRLRPGVATIVAFGDRLDLGDDVVVTIERVA